MNVQAVAQVRSGRERETIIEKQIIEFVWPKWSDRLFEMYITMK